MYPLLMCGRVAASLPRLYSDGDFSRWTRHKMQRGQRLCKSVERMSGTLLTVRSMVLLATAIAFLLLN